MTDPRRIDRNSDRPAYRQLADILRDQISRGEIADQLPSKRELADTYDVSINTVEGALRLLVVDGLIVTERGRHTRVRPTRLVTDRRYAAGQVNYHPEQESAFAREHGVPWSRFELGREYRTIPAPPRVATALGLAEGALVVQRRWTHATGGRMLRVSWSYLDSARFGATILCDLDEPPWPGGTIAQLTHLGHQVETDPPTDVRVRPATEEEASILELELGTMVLESFRIHVEQGAVAGSWQALECAVHVYPWYGVTLTFNSLERREWKTYED